MIPAPDHDLALWLVFDLTLSISSYLIGWSIFGLAPIFIWGFDPVPCEVDLGFAPLFLSLLSHVTWMLIPWLARILRPVNRGDLIRIGMCFNLLGSIPTLGSLWLYRVVSQFMPHLLGGGVCDVCMSVYMYLAWVLAYLLDDCNNYGIGVYSNKLQ